MIEMKTSMKRLEDIPASKETKRKNMREIKKKIRPVYKVQHPNNRKKRENGEKEIANEIIHENFPELKKNF